MAKHRRTLLGAPPARLHRLPNPFVGVDTSVLHSYRGELAALARAADNEVVRIASLIAMVNQAICIDEQDRETALVVSDHAVLRWLERHDGVDMERARQAIFEMVERAAPEVAVRDSVVVTVLPEGCASLESVADEAQARR